MYVDEDLEVRRMNTLVFLLCILFLLVASSGAR